MMRGRRLSKSKLMAARQCLKRLHLEIHRPDLAEVTADAERAFATGHEVGVVARRIYGTADAVLIAYEGGLTHALRKTKRLVAAGPAFPIFEATFEYSGVLVRIDALLPDREAWRIVEVKASTRLEPHYHFDCAVQSYVFRQSGYPLSGVSLAHVDNTFVYPGEGDYAGLLADCDLGEALEAIEPDVPAWIRTAREAADGDEPAVPVGGHCFTPYDCPFIRHCWPMDAEHPLFELPRANKRKLAEFVASGYRDIREVPAEKLTATQRRVQRVTRSGQPELAAGAGEFVRALPYPRYYLDFETLGPPVPVFPGTRPYQALPFQWSCHYEEAPGALRHAEFLDLSGDPPFRRLAQSLIRVLGSAGPILTYSPYERTIIGRLADLYAELAPALASIAARLVDLRPVVQEGYYHPGMRGSWSIKAVLPQIAPDMDYQKLEGIQEGTAASSAYLEAIDPDTATSRRVEIDRQLRRYCRFDTAALVRLVEFFAAH